MKQTRMTRMTKSIMMGKWWGWSCSTCSQNGDKTELLLHNINSEEDTFEAGWYTTITILRTCRVEKDHHHVKRWHFLRFYPGLRGGDLKIRVLNLTPSDVKNPRNFMNLINQDVPETVQQNPIVKSLQRDLARGNNLLTDQTEIWTLCSYQPTVDKQSLLINSYSSDRYSEVTILITSFW